MPGLGGFDIKTPFGPPLHLNNGMVRVTEEIFGTVQSAGPKILAPQNSQSFLGTFWNLSKMTKKHHREATERKFCRSRDPPGVGPDQGFFLTLGMKGGGT